MEQKLDEKFVIKNTKDRNEYIQKIEAFINIEPKLQPEAKRNQLQGFDKSFFHRYGCVELDTSYFTRKDLNTYSYAVSIVYSRSLKKKKVVIFQYGYWNRNSAHFLEDASFLSIGTLKTLYKKLVLEVIHPSILLREKKNLRDGVYSFNGYKFHYNPKTKKCITLLNYTVKPEHEQVSLKYDEISLCGVEMRKGRYSYGYTYTYNDFKKHFLEDGMVHTNDFKNDIIPLYTDEISKNIETINAKNATIFDSVKVS